jgi:hypothetical protein
VKPIENFSLRFILLLIVLVGNSSCMLTYDPNNPPAPKAASATHTISGSIAGPQASGIAIQLSGAASSNAVTDASGFYSFSGLKNGNYAITPTANGYTFTPSSLAVTVSGSDAVGQNFTDAVNADPLHTISGSISGALAAGIAIQLTGSASSAATTDASGHYSFSGLKNGNYTVIPTASGYTFTPSSVAVTVDGIDVTNQNFTDIASAAPRHVVSGTVSGIVSSGISVTLSGEASASVFTDSAGAYRFSVQDGNYIVTPSAAGFVFTPVSRSVKADGADIAGQDFQSDLQLLLDPEFQNTPQGAWTLAGGAVIDPSAGGLVQGGNLVFSEDAICRGHGTASQTITMPSFADVGPTALNVTSEGKFQYYDTHGSLISHWIAPTVLVNARSLPYEEHDTFAFESHKYCLGELAYGGALTLEVGTLAWYCGDGPTTLFLNVDRVEIGQDASCPQIRTILNQDFESNGNWAFLNGAIQNGVGVAGSRGAHLAATSSSSCAGPSDQATGTASLPAGANVSMQMAINGTLHRSLSVGESTGVVWATVTGGGGTAFQAVNVCVPEYAKGMVEALRFSLPCTQAAADFYIDNLSFMTNTACPADASIIDGGFELSNANVSYWDLQMALNGVAGSVNAQIVSGASDAHSGSKYLLLSASPGNGISAQAQAVASVPGNLILGGPALRYYYKYPTKTTTRMSVIAGGLSDSPPQQASYTQRTFCLPPVSAGEALLIQFYLASGNPAATESVYIDDVSIGTDPSCPTQ